MEKQKIKFSEEELTKVKSISSGLEECILKYGQLHLEKKRLEESFNALAKYEEEINQLYYTTKKEEESFLSDITKKYGEGSLDLNSGEFIPN